MNTLLLRLAGPMQSWGTQSRFSQRDTGLEPSKSGVIGLLCAALGRPREQVVDDLAALRMGVRVNQEGAVQRDYQTTGGSHRSGEIYGVIQADGKLGGTVLSNRYYLADADFLVGLAGYDLGLLESLSAALRRPRWQLCFGRKAFVPGVPVTLPDGGLRPGLELLEALRAEPWPERRGELRFVLETDPGLDGETRHDQPIGAAFATRQFGPRQVGTALYAPPDEPLAQEV